MSLTLLGTRNLGITGLNLTHSLFNDVAIVQGDQLVLAVMGYKRSGDTPPVQAGVPATVGSAEVWVQETSQLVASGGDDKVWLGVFSSEALAAYDSGQTFEVDTTFPVTTRFTALLFRHSGVERQSHVDLHSGAEPYDVSFDDDPSAASVLLVVCAMRKGGNLAADVDWPLSFGASGESAGGDNFYSFSTTWDDGISGNQTITIDPVSVAGSVDAATYIVEWGLAVHNNPLELPPTKLSLKVFPNKTFASMLDSLDA